MGGVHLMGDKRISGAAKKVRGSITEALGKLTGDKAVENRGAAQKREAEKELKASASKKPAKENPHNSGYMKRRTPDR
jgi:uncharacterized protein YjbJ (UPF0337 family)